MDRQKQSNRKSFLKGLGDILKGKRRSYHPSSYGRSDSISKSADDLTAGAGDGGSTDGHPSSTGRASNRKAKHNINNTRSLYFPVLEARRESDTNVDFNEHYQVQRRGGIFSKNKKTKVPARASKRENFNEPNEEIQDLSWTQNVNLGNKPDDARLSGLDAMPSSDEVETLSSAMMKDRIKVKPQRKNPRRRVPAQATPVSPTKELETPEKDTEPEYKPESTKKPDLEKTPEVEKKSDPGNKPEPAQNPEVVAKPVPVAKEANDDESSDESEAEQEDKQQDKSSSEGNLASVVQVELHPPQTESEPDHSEKEEESSSSDESDHDTPAAVAASSKASSVRSLQAESPVPDKQPEIPPAVKVESAKSSPAPRPKSSIAGRASIFGETKNVSRSKSMHQPRKPPEHANDSERKSDEFSHVFNKFRKSAIMENGEVVITKSPQKAEETQPKFEKKELKKVEVPKKELVVENKDEEPKPDIVKPSSLIKKRQSFKSPEAGATAPKQDRNTDADKELDSNNNNSDDEKEKGSKIASMHAEKHNEDAPADKPSKVPQKSPRSSVKEEPPSTDTADQPPPWAAMAQRKSSKWKDKKDDDPLPVAEKENKKPEVTRMKPTLSPTNSNNNSKQSSDNNSTPGNNSDDGLIGGAADPKPSVLALMKNFQS